MPGAQSRTPIDPRLVHDPAQVALDAARLSEIGNLIPKDVAERLIRETGRRSIWDLLCHPLDILRGIGLVLVLPPNALAQSSRDRRRGRHESERSPVDMLRGSFAATWVEALDAAIEESHGKPVELGDDLFPSKSPSKELEGWSSWRDYLAYQFGHDLDDRAVASLMDAFALHMGAVIRSHCWNEITREVAIRWDGTSFTAERITPRTA